MTSSLRNPQIIIFSKIPTLKPVKTRLLNDSCLDKSQVHNLALALLSDTIELAHSLCTDVILNCDPEVSHTELENLLQFHKISAPSCIREITIQPQRGSSFEQRLQNAQSSAQASDRGVLILGSDAAYYPLNSLENALAAVSEGRFAIGPSLGCGIYYIGIPAQAIEQRVGIFSIFSDLVSSEIEDFSKTVKKAGFELEIGPLHFDVDLESDLIQLVSLSNAIATSSNTVAFYRESLATRECIEKLRLSVNRSKENSRILELRITPRRSADSDI